MPSSSRRSTSPRWLGKLELQTERGPVLGDVRIRLLEAIAETGSISKAAPLVPLSYKGAWDAVDAMNNLAEQPLVARSTGGRQGGGTTLTTHGLKMVALYRAMEAESQAALYRVMGQWATLGHDGAQDVRAFQHLLRGMAMRTSARNQFVCTVERVDAGPVDVALSLRLDAAHALSVVITQTSAERLGVQVGTALMVLVKASAVSISRRAPAGAGTSPVRGPVRNRLWGEVGRCIDGGEHSEVTLDLGGGRTVTAVLPTATVNKLAPQAGERLCAHFLPSAAIVSVLG